MPKHTSPEWRELLQDVFSELDAEKLPEKIGRAEAVIYQRMERAKAKAEAEVEQQSLDDALSSPSILKKRHFPGWSR
jgi:hypothetical protein